MELDWQNLQALAENKFSDVENKPGIYFIRWKKYDTPITINRLGGADSKGLLYIGESKNLRKRFQRLWRGITKVNDTNSKTIHTLRKTLLFCRLHKEIKINEYEITWQHLPTKIEAQMQEVAALKLYIEKYKEPPPLNLKVCRQKYLNWGLISSDEPGFTEKTNEFVKSIISRKLSKSIIAEYFERDSFIILWRLRLENCLIISVLTLRAKSFESVSKTAEALVSCSHRARISEAT